MAADKSKLNTKPAKKPMQPKQCDTSDEEQPNVEEELTTDARTFGSKDLWTMRPDRSKLNTKPAKTTMHPPTKNDYDPPNEDSSNEELRPTYIQGYE